MEFYAVLFEPIMPHLKEYAVLYIVGIPVLIGLIAVTRRYSIPLLIFLLEIIVCGVVMHTLVHVITIIFAWFKNSSSMKMVKTPEDVVNWTTPLLRFWQAELYNPTWIIWFEVILLVLILLLIYRFRPLKPQYKHKSRYKKHSPNLKRLQKPTDWGLPKHFTPPPARKSSGNQLND
jgi:hypothetical protein